MTPSAVRALGGIIYAQTLKPRRTDREARRIAILGFDTEFDAMTGALLSLQFTHDGAEQFVEWPEGKPLTWEEVYGIVLAFLAGCGRSVSPRKMRQVLLVSYFSLADVQHLDLLSPHVRIDEWGAANYDFTWQAKRRLHRFRDGRPAEWKTEQSVRVVDLQTWFRGQPLAAAARSFGAGEKLAWAREKISRADLAQEAFRQYAMNDAHLAERIFLRLREITMQKYDVDTVLTRTPASTSMSIFRRRYLRTQYQNRTSRLRRLALLCAWGGNNQAFSRGVFQGTFTEYDAVSMYPSSVLALAKLPNEQDWLRVKSLASAIRPVNRGGFCHVAFSFPKGTEYPCLPVYVKGALVYPLEGETYCTLEEVRAALVLGADVDARETWVYQTGGTEFARYMRDQMQLKDEAETRGDLAARALHKLYMNAVIGKLAQRRFNYDLNQAKQIAAERMIPLHDLLSIPNLLQQVPRRVLLGSGWYPEWNALILGYARATLGLAFARTRALVGTTDSLICSGDHGDGFSVNGIHFKRKGSGDTLKVVRTRLYLLTQGTEVRHIAFHGVHGFQNGLSLLASWQDGPAPEWRYTRTHIVKVREAFRTQRRPGESETRPFRTVLLWDNKRRLQEAGKTAAWQTAEQMVTESKDTPEVLWQLIILERTLRDALDFDRPGRFPAVDPATGQQTGEWYGVKAPLPGLDPDLAAAFPKRSPRDLLAAMQKGRGSIYAAIRQFAIERVEHRAWAGADHAR